MDNKPFDITDVSTDEIVQELNRRHDGLVLVTLKDTVVNGEMSEATVVHFMGGRAQALGLLHYGIFDIQNKYVDNRIEENL